MTTTTPTPTEAETQTRRQRLINLGLDYGIVFAVGILFIVLAFQSDAF